MDNSPGHRGKIKNKSIVTIWRWERYVYVFLQCPRIFTDKSIKLDSEGTPYVLLSPVNHIPIWDQWDYYKIQHLIWQQITFNRHYLLTSCSTLQMYRYLYWNVSQVARLCSICINFECFSFIVYSFLLCPIHLMFPNICSAKA